jgi:hypothetical protein
MEPDALEYGPPPALHRRRWLRRLALRLTVLAVLVAAGARWGPVAWRQSELLYRQRQCLQYTAPPDQIVCSEPLPTAGRMFPFSFEAAPPAAMYRLLLSAGEMATVPAAGPVLFMHERSTASGKRRLVILQRRPSPLRQSWDLPIAYTVTLVEPATVTTPPHVQSRLLVEVVPREYSEPPDTGSPAPPDALRFFAGQPDPADASRFTVRYQRGPHAGVLHGVLKDAAPYASGVDREGPVLRLEAEETAPGAVR